MKIEWQNVREIAVGVAIAFFLVEGVKLGLTKLSQVANSMPSTTTTSNDKS